MMPGDAATPVLPDFTSQTATVYKTNIDAGFAVLDRLAWTFAPHEQSTPDMTVRLEVGAIFDGTTLTEVAVQSTGTITAPSVNPRIDRVVIDRGTGVVSVITGSEAPSPSPPAITASKVPIAQVALVVSQSSITNSDITDERDLGFLGDPQPNVITTRGDVIRGSAAGAAERLALGTDGQLLSSDGADAVWGGAGVLRTSQVLSGTLVDFTSIPSWVKKITIMFVSISTNGASLPIIQLGDAGGIETTGYFGASGIVSAAPGSLVLSTGFALGSGWGAAVQTSGIMTLALEDNTDNTWVASLTMGRSDSAQVLVMGGRKLTSAVLTQIRFTMVNGTDTFDAGTVNIIYE